MMDLNLTGNPFYLSAPACQWVEETLAGMTLEEKAGQLFCPVAFSSDMTYITKEILPYHPGGLMFKTAPPAEIRQVLSFMHTHSKVPLLCPGNLEFGSSGYMEGGTLFAQQMGIGATRDPKHAYRMGSVSTKEAAAAGCNWAFAPVSDLDLNWRNPIVNVRSYGADPEQVLSMCLAYKKAADENGVAVSIKHFPGDGVDEVDQHLLISVNTLSCEEWEESYGRLYRGLIADGAMSFMIGHIDLPSWRYRLNPELPEGIVPASQSRELMTGLLRERLGFNGLIITDATPMVGYNCGMKREQAVPWSIAAGADMFLFNKDYREDFQYMMQGIEQGILTVERLDEAVTRILAMKAALGLWNQDPASIIPPENVLDCIGCGIHHQWARECAEEAIVLVKDTQSALPISPEKTKRVLLEVLGDCETDAHVAEYMTAKLEQEGFAVTIYQPEDFATYRFGVKPFTDQYDLVIYLGNVENASNKTTNRIHWKTFWGHGDNVPWFVHEVPVIFASLANPYHLVDVPMIKTYINCFTNNDETLDALVEKLTGRDHFRGVSPTDPFCGKEWTRY